MKNIMGLAAGLLLVSGTCVLCESVRYPGLPPVELLRDALNDEPRPGDWNPQVGDLPEKMAPFKDAKLAPPPASGAKRLVCIDPGHPSPYSKGDALNHGLKEFQINWAVAGRLRSILESRGVTVFMTKSREDELVDNQDRAILINNAAERFLEVNPDGVALAAHLHCDGGSPERGFAVFYPDRKGKYSGTTGKEPNIGFVGPGGDVLAASRRLAEVVVTAMTNALKDKLGSRGAARGDSKTEVGGRQGALSYSIFSKIPTVTIEMVMLTNKNDAKFIGEASNQQKMAEAIAAGLLAY